MEKENKWCVHFTYCGVYIVEDLVRRQKKILGEEFPEQTWEKEFCLSGDSEACIYFKDGPKKKEIFEKFKKGPVFGSLTT